MWTGAGLSTATWCPAGPGRTIRNGCGSSSGCCGSTRQSSLPSSSPADPALFDGARHDAEVVALTCDGLEHLTSLSVADGRTDPDGLPLELRQMCP